MRVDLAHGLTMLRSRMVDLLQRSRASRYLGVGGICAIANNAIVIGLDLVGVHYTVSIVIAFVLVTTLAYYLHAVHTFRVPLSAPALARFFAGNLGGFGISVALMVLFCSGIGLSSAVAMPIVTALLLAWNFTVARWALSKHAPS